MLLLVLGEMILVVIIKLKWHNLIVKRNLKGEVKFVTIVASEQFPMMGGHYLVQIVSYHLMLF